MLPRSGKIIKNTPFQLSQLVSSFRESSQKFFVQIFTKNLAFNLSGAFFFVGLGCSLKWWYKDQLLIVLLKQNLPALSQPEQKISWETGEYILKEQNHRVTEKKDYSSANNVYNASHGEVNIINKTFPFTKSNGVDKVETEEIKGQYLHNNHLIERIDFYSNHAVVKFKSPWQKHVYQRFIGVFSEPAQITNLQNLFRTKEETPDFKGPKGSEPFVSTLSTMQAPFVSTPHAFGSYVDKVAREAGLSFASPKGYKSRNEGIEDLTSLPKYTFWEPITPVKWFQLPARGLCRLNEEISLDFLESAITFDPESIKKKYLPSTWSTRSKKFCVGFGKPMVRFLQFPSEISQFAKSQTDLLSTSLTVNLQPIRWKALTSFVSPFRIQTFFFKKQILKSSCSFDKKFLELRANIRTNHISSVNDKKSNLDNTNTPLSLRVVDSVKRAEGVRSRPTFGSFKDGFSVEKNYKIYEQDSCKHQNKSLNTISPMTLSGYDQKVKEYQRITNSSQIFCPLATKIKNSNIKLTITKKFSYPLELTKTLTGWQPPIDSLILNSYLDEIPYKLDSILIFFPCKKNTQNSYVDKVAREAGLSFPSPKGYKSQNEGVHPLKIKVPELTLSGKIPKRSKKGLPIPLSLRDTVFGSYPLGIQEVANISVSFFDSYQSRPTIPVSRESIKILNSNHNERQNSFFYPYVVQAPRVFSTDLQDYNNSVDKNLTHRVPRRGNAHISLNNQTKPFFIIKTPNETFFKKLQLIEINQLLKNELQLLINKLPLHFVYQSLSKERNVVPIPKLDQSIGSKKEITTYTKNNFQPNVEPPKDKGAIRIEACSNFNHGFWQFRRQLPSAKSIDTNKATHDYHQVPCTYLGLVVPDNTNLMPLRGNSIDRKNKVTTNPLYHNSYHVVDKVETEEGRSDEVIGSELDSKTWPLARTPVNSVDMNSIDELDSLYLLNNLGFTFNNLSPLNTPPLLLPIYNSGSFWMWNKPILSKQFFGTWDFYRKIISVIGVTISHNKNGFLNFQKTPLNVSALTPLGSTKSTKTLRGKKFINEVDKQIIFRFSPTSLTWEISYQPDCNKHISLVSTKSIKNKLKKEIESSQLLLSNKIILKENKTIFESIKGVNPLDKKVHFENRKSRFMSGYVYPDIESNLLKTNLHRGIPLLETKSTCSFNTFDDINKPIYPLQGFKTSLPFGFEFVDNTYTNMIGDYQKSRQCNFKSPYLCNITTKGQKKLERIPSLVDQRLKPKGSIKSYPEGVEKSRDERIQVEGYGKFTKFPRGIKKFAQTFRDKRKETVSQYDYDKESSDQVKLHNKISWALYPTSFQQVSRFLDQFCLAGIEIPITRKPTLFSRYFNASSLSPACHIPLFTGKNESLKKCSTSNPRLQSELRLNNSLLTLSGTNTHNSKMLTNKQLEGLFIDNVNKNNGFNNVKKAAFPILETQINNFLPLRTPLSYSQRDKQIDEIMPVIQYDAPVGVTYGVLNTCFKRISSIFRYQELNHHLAYFPGFTRPNQFLFSLTKIAHGDDAITVNNVSSFSKNSFDKEAVDSQITTSTEPLGKLPKGSDKGETKEISEDYFLSQSTFHTNGMHGVDKVAREAAKATKNIGYEKYVNGAERNGLLNKSGEGFVDCNSRKTAYHGIVMERNNLTKDFQPLRELIKQYSLWGTAFLASENPFTDRQSHFFGQKQLSTIDTNSSQRDFLRQLGRETLTQSNCRGWCEASVTPGAERAKILSFSKTINSFSFKKRKYTYLLEKKDQWHLLFQEQLRTALQDPRKYPPLTPEEIKNPGPGRIKISAPLIMARFPKRLFPVARGEQMPLSLNHRQGDFISIPGHQKGNNSNLSKSSNFYLISLSFVEPKALSLGDTGVAREAAEGVEKSRNEGVRAEQVHLGFVKSSEWPKLQHNFPWRPVCYLESYQLLPPIALIAKDEKIGQNVEHSLSLPKIVSHYPLFAEKHNFELNYVPRLNKSWFSIPNNLFGKSLTYPLLSTPGRQSRNQGGNTYFSYPVINLQWLTHETLTANSWAIICQWSFLVALLFWVEQMLVNNVFPALFALEQLLLGANGLKSNDRENVIRVSKSDTPKFQDIAGIDGLLGELAELVLFLRGHKERLCNKKSSYGVLLTGPPGTGKTFLVRALANEAKVPVLILSAGALTANRWNNNKPSWSIRHAFRRAKQLAPCILFIDEIDALGRSRGKIVTDINEIAAHTNLGLPNLHRNQNEITNSTNTFHSEIVENEKVPQNWSSIGGINAQTKFFKKEINTANSVDTINTEIDRCSLCEDDRSNSLRNFIQGVSIGSSIHNLSNKMGTEQSPGGEITDGFASQERIKRKFGPLTQLLVSMDGVKSLSGVLIMGATNRPESLDTALTRPGRFERIIRIEKPAEQKRIEILKLYSSNLGVQHKIPWSYLANRTVGLTAADLAVAMNYSSLKAIAQGSRHTIETIEYGLDSIARFPTAPSVKTGSAHLFDSVTFVPHTPKRHKKGETN